MKQIKLKQDVNPNGEQFPLAGGRRTAHRMVIIQEGADDLVGRMFQEVHSARDRELVFTGTIIQLLKWQRPDWELESKVPLVIEITTYKGSSTVNLRNLYTECSNATPEEKLEKIREFIGTILSIEEHAGQPVDIDDVVPVVKALAKTGTDEFLEVLNENLALFYAADTEDSMVFIRKKELERLELSPEELRHKALQNLARKFPKVAFKRLDEGVCQPVVDGNYETSFILIPEVWNKMAHGVKGDFVYGLPCRGTLLFCDSADGKAVRHLRELTKWHFVRGPYPISDKLFVWRNEKLEIFTNR